MASAPDAAENDIIVQWIIDNYEIDPDLKGPGVPRGDMYDRYASYSRSFLRKKPANTAVFGKVVRTVFPDIKTRRLGNRGNSRYHYCGIIDKHRPQNASFDASSSATHEPTNVSLPPFNIPLTGNDETNHLLQQMSSTYHQHCSRLLSLINSRQYKEADQCILLFRKSMPSNIQQFICTDISAWDLIWRWDCILYETIVAMSFSPFTGASPITVPAELQQWLNQLPCHLSKAWDGFPPEVIEKKQDVAQIFLDKFTRYLSLYQLANSAEEGLETYQNMHADWQTLDTQEFAEKIVWIMDDCLVEDDTILGTLHAIGRMLECRSSIKEWIKFLEQWVENFLTERPTIQAARQMMQKWSLCSSLAMRELAVRNIQSLEGFNKLQLFVNDFLTYLAEERIAKMNIEAIKLHSRQESFMLMDDASYDAVHEQRLLSVAAPQE